MEKYKRFTQEINGDAEIQEFLDELTIGGWRIIYYNEEIKDVKIMSITIIGAKIQPSML